MLERLNTVIEKHMAFVTPACLILGVAFPEITGKGVTLVPDVYKRQLYQRLPEEKVTPNGMVGAVYYDKEFNRECSDIELVVGIREREKADRTIEKGLCARTLHRGAYSTLSELSLIHI